MQPDSSDLLYMERLYFFNCPVHVEGEYITLKGSHPLEKNFFLRKIYFTKNFAKGGGGGWGVNLFS